MAFARLMELKLVQFSAGTSEDVPKMFRPCESMVDDMYQKWVPWPAGADPCSRFKSWALLRLKSFSHPGGRPARAEGQREVAKPSEAATRRSEDLGSEGVPGVRGPSRGLLGVSCFLAKGALSLGTLMRLTVSHACEGKRNFRQDEP